MRQEGVKIAKGPQFTSKQILLFFRKGCKAFHRQINKGIELLVVCRAVAALTEPDGAEGLHFFTVDDPAFQQFTVQLVEPLRIRGFAHVGAFVIGLECFVNVGTLVAEVEHKGITFARCPTVQA